MEDVTTAHDEWVAARDRFARALGGAPLDEAEVLDAEEAEFLARRSFYRAVFAAYGLRHPLDHDGGGPGQA